MARVSLLLLVVVLIIAPAAPAHAHGGEGLTDGTAWSTWRLTADIVIPTALAALVYAAGMVRRSAVTEPAPWWRHSLFFAGLAAVFLALQSPIDPIAERLFLIHQIQHLLLRMVGPMLIALAWPQGDLIAGLPATIRRTLLAPVVANGAIRGVFGTVSDPVVATAMFIGALYFWQIPRYHDLALLNEPVHYVMHATMLLAGLVFWWRIFDRRPPGPGLRYGVRLMMLWLVILSNILLGAYIALKNPVLYGAYDVLGRLFDYAPLADEQVGGFVIWIPSSMMCVVAVLIVIHMGGRHETKLDQKRSACCPSNSGAMFYPTTASELIQQQGSKNRVLALGFAAFVLTVFGAAILVGLLGSGVITSS